MLLALTVVPASSEFRLNILVHCYYSHTFQSMAGPHQCPATGRLRVCHHFNLFRTTPTHVYLSYSHPTEPQCSYDPVEGLPIAPDIDPAERIRTLEEQICRSTSLKWPCSRPDPIPIQLRLRANYTNLAASILVLPPLLVISRRLVVQVLRPPMAKAPKLVPMTTAYLSLMLRWT